MITLTMVRNARQSAAQSTQLSTEERERRTEEARVSARLAESLSLFCEPTAALAAANIEGTPLFIVESEYRSRVEVRAGAGTEALITIDVIQGAKVAGTFPAPRYVVEGAGLARQEYDEPSTMPAVWNYLRGELRVRRQPLS